MYQKTISLVLALLAFVITAGAGCAPQRNQLSATKTPAVTEDNVETAAQKMIEFMKDNPTDPDLLITPVAADQNFTGKIIKSGTFQRLNYLTFGNVSLVTREGKNYIIFEQNFSTPNGPDLELYLTKNTGPTTRADIKAGLALGKIKSTTGKQMYELPAEVNADEYHAVSIHCQAFNVPWSYAVLQ